MSVFKKLISPLAALKKEDIKGELPSDSSIFSRTFEMAWPSAVESILIALISCVDMVMVGRLGKEAISAVGICSQPRFLVLAPIFSLNTAAIVLIARRKGEGLKDEANGYMKIAIIISIVFSLILCALFYVFAREIMLFAGAQNDYLDLSLVYFRIVVVSLIPYAIGLTMTSCQRGAGYTKISLITNLTANIVNIIFNAILINGLLGFPALGVKGAAIATAIGNFVSFVIALRSLLRKNAYLHLDLNRIEKPLSKVKSLYSVFINAFGEQLIMRFGFFMYAKVVADLGTAQFAAHQVVGNIMSITFSCGDGLQIANTSLVGQSLGAKRSDMAIVYTKAARLIGTLMSLILFVAIFGYCDMICGVFTSDQEVLMLSRIPMYLLGITCLFQIPQVIVVGALRGAGDVRFVTFMMFICVGIIRPGLSYLLAYPFGLGLNGAWIGLFFDQFARFAYSMYHFKKGKWTDIQV